MTWHKLGKAFAPEDRTSTPSSHVQVPTALVLDDRVRVFYAARDENNKAYPAYVDFSEDCSTVIHTHESPVLMPSQDKIGLFDADGIMPSDFIHKDGEIWMYYSGWNTRNDIAYHNTVGIAVSDDGGNTFERMFDGPILDRTHLEPYLAVTPFVLELNGEWWMWYISGIDWIVVDGRTEPVYVIRFATSDDAIHWKRNPDHICIPQYHEHEAFSGPTVWLEDDTLHMLFCARGCVDYREGNGGYRMGYASSKDGINWERNDDLAGIEVGSEGDWDHQMVCYPHVFSVNNQRMMVYNGNSFGQTGFGFARWEK